MHTTQQISDGLPLLLSAPPPLQKNARQFPETRTVFISSVDFLCGTSLLFLRAGVLSIVAKICRGLEATVKFYF